jgi:hypothetical protein
MRMIAPVEDVASMAAWTVRKSPEPSFATTTGPGAKANEQQDANDAAIKAAPYRVIMLDILNHCRIYRGSLPHG